MGKVNYYSIHKNKKPKKLIKKLKYRCFLGTRLALSQMNFCVQLHILKSQPSKKQQIINKHLYIVDLIVKSYETAIKLTQQEKQIRFTKTKRYIK